MAEKVLLPISLAAESVGLVDSTARSTAVVCGQLIRPWPPIYSRLASAIRPARRAVDEHAAGAGLREDRTAKAPANSLSPTYPPYLLHSASLTYHRAHHLTSLASRIAFVLVFTVDWLSVSCVAYHVHTIPPGIIHSFWTGLAPTDSVNIHSLPLPRQTHPVLHLDHLHTRVSHGTMTAIVDIIHYIVHCL